MEITPLMSGGIIDRNEGGNLITASPLLAQTAGVVRSVRTAIGLLIARLGDIVFGICSHPSHGSPLSIAGTITGSASKTYCESKLIARLGDEVTSNCGHNGSISTSSTSVYTESKRTARKDDKFSGVYAGTITGGASKTYAS